MPSKKSSNMDRENIENLANDKLVVYKIKNKKDEVIYIGVTKRGRVQARIKEHLSTGKDPIPGGVRVEIEQKSTIDKAKKLEKIRIKKTKPKYNKQGK